VVALAVAAPTARAADDGSNTTALLRGIETFNHGARVWSRELMEQAEARFRQAQGEAPGLAEPLYWLAVAQFHLTLYHVSAPDSTERTGAGARCLRTTADTLEQALALQPTNAECHALLAAVGGMRILGRPASALWVGPRLLDHQRQAMAFGAGNPRVRYLLGTSSFHGPARLGGKSKALEHFLAAERLFEQERAALRGPAEPSWGYDNCLGFIGRTYAALGDRARALAYYRKALAANPDNTLGRAGLRTLGDR
jgi:tetratricopeptide (TPR) repeat protein